MAFCLRAAFDLPGTSPASKSKTERTWSVTARRTAIPCRDTSGPSAARRQPAPGLSRCLLVKYTRAIADSPSPGDRSATLLQPASEPSNARAAASAIRSSFEEKRELSDAQVAVYPL